MNRMRSVGIVGGVGPGATSWMYLELIERATRRDPSRYPLVHIYSLPLPREVEQAFIHGIATPSNERALVADTIAAVQSLRDQGAGLILIPCNTIHLYLEEVRREAGGVLIADMPRLTSTRIRKGVRTLVLGTSMSKGRLLYGREEMGSGASGLVYPNAHQQAAIDGIIDCCIRMPKFDPWPDLAEVIGPPGSAYDDVLLGCTDLCTSWPPAEHATVINSLSELVESGVRYLGGSKMSGAKQLQARTYERNLNEF